MTPFSFPQVTANSQNYGFTYADNGLLTGRSNPFRTLSVDSRDGAGRVLQQTNVVGSVSPLIENLTWRVNGTLNSYAATRTGTGAWSESRAYTYNSHGQLLSEGFSAAPGVSNTFTYTFDGSSPGLGLRLTAKADAGAPAGWESDATTVNALGRVTADSTNAGGRVVAASGVSLGADHVDILLDGVTQGRATHPGWADSVGAWSISLNFSPGAHTLTANAVHPSGYTVSSANTFNVHVAAAAIITAYDDEGNVTSRTFASGVTQTLTWDAQNRLIKVAQRDGSGNGYDWTAVYDGLGRRLQTVQQPVVNNVANGAATTIASIRDPLVKYLEIGVSVNGVKAWKVNTVDTNERYGGMQGTGGLEAVILDAGGATTGILNDRFGNGLGTISGSTVTWNATHVGAYGPLPGNVAQPLTSITQLASAVSWRGRYIDGTGFYDLGRPYEPKSARFVSADPLGHAASASLYGFCQDPVNYFDPDGCCPKSSNDGTPSVPYYLAQNPNAPNVAGGPNNINDPSNLNDWLISQMKIPNNSGQPIIIVTPGGNALPVPAGGWLGGTDNGEWIEVKNPDGTPGIRIDGGHQPTGPDDPHNDPGAQVPHAHIPGVTNPDGTPWLPVKPEPKPATAPTPDSTPVPSVAAPVPSSPFTAPSYIPAPSPTTTRNVIIGAGAAGAAWYLWVIPAAAL